MNERKEEIIEKQKYGELWLNGIVMAVIYVRADRTVTVIPNRAEGVVLKKEP